MRFGKQTGRMPAKIQGPVPKQAAEPGEPGSTLAKIRPGMLMPGQATAGNSRADSPRLVWKKQPLPTGLRLW